MRGVFAKIKRPAVLAALALCLALFTGCGVSVTLYDGTENGVRYNTYEVSIDTDVVAAMESSATLDRNGNKYTVRDYLYSLFTEFGYELVSAEITGGKYTVSYKKPVTGESELFDIGTPVKFEYTSTQTPFVRTYVASSPNPFDGVREYYDNIDERRSQTVLERLKNGVTAHDEYGDPVTVFAAIDEAFPYLKGQNPDGIRLDYVQTRSDRMTSSGTAETVGYRTVRYRFSRYFDYTTNTIDYEYRRAVPFGWYLFAAAAGATVYVIILVCKRDGALMN